MSAGKPIVRVSHDFSAPAECVFDAWLDPAQIGRWMFGPEVRDEELVHLYVDPRVGGSFSFLVRRQGALFDHVGTYREISRPNRVVFTWGIAGSSSDESVVTIDVRPTSGGCELTLTHEMDPKWAEFAGRTEQGWTTMLAKLAAPLQGATPSSTFDREIVLTRVVDAPREVVWKVWTDPNHLARWWGPTGFSTTTHRMEVKAGGVWRFTMHGPDGRDYENMITYTEIDEPKRLSYRHGGEKGLEPTSHRVTVTFDKEGASGNKTRITMRSVFASAAARDFIIRQYGAIEGGKQTLGRLAEYVGAIDQTESAGGPQSRPFTITRVVAAPRPLAWDAWTKREHLMHWFGPKGVTIDKATIDLRPDGVFHFCMRSPDGPAMWCKWVFHEIIEHQRLRFSVAFSDEAGGLTRHPLNPSWPLEMLSTITFADHAGIGRGTVITIEWLPVNPTDAERRTFDTGHESMRQGWTGTFEQLDEYLASLVK